MLTLVFCVITTVFIIVKRISTNDAQIFQWDIVSVHCHNNYVSSHLTEIDKNITVLNAE